MLDLVHFPNINEIRHQPGNLIHQTWILSQILTLSCLLRDE